MDTAFHPHGLDRLITDFTEHVPGVVRALVVSSDGVPVAAAGQLQPDDLQELSAITSGLIGLARGAVEVTDGGVFTQAVVAMEQGTLVIMAIDDGSSLAVLTTAAADLDQVAHDMTMLVGQAGGIGSPPIRDTIAGGTPASADGTPASADGTPATLPAILPRRHKPGPATGARRVQT